jgi:transcription elongation factor
MEEKSPPDYKLRRSSDHPRQPAHGGLFYAQKQHNYEEITMAYIGQYQQYTIDGSAPVARVQDWMKQATAINAGLATAKDEAVTAASAYTDLRETTAVDAANTDGQGFVPAWKPSTVYALNQQVLLPNGDVGTPVAAFTSGATFDATKWKPSGAVRVQANLSNQNLDTITTPGV